MVNIVSAYGPQVGCDEDEKEDFWTDLEDLIGEMSEKEEFVIGGDLNRHVGKETDGYPRVHGGRGYGERNEEGRRILDMAQRNNLMVCNTRYRKDNHLITYSSGERKSPLDFILVKQSDAKNLKNCKVIPGSEIVNQHRIAVIEWWRSKESKRKARKIGKFKTWQLKEGAKLELREKVQKASAVRTEDGGVEEIW